MMRIIKKTSNQDEDDCNCDLKSGKIYAEEKLRIITISGFIDEKVADIFFNTLLIFETKKDKKSPIDLFINSSGGEVYPTLKIYDHIKNSPILFNTTVSGWVFSGGLYIFLAGDLRTAFPNAFLGFHPPIIFPDENGQTPNETAENLNHQNQMLDKLVEIVKKNSNLDKKTIRNYVDRHMRIDAETALNFGLIHKIIEPPKKILPKEWQKIISLGIMAKTNRVKVIMPVR